LEAASPAEVWRQQTFESLLQQQTDQGQSDDLSDFDLTCSWMPRRRRKRTMTSLGLEDP
jgi:hypothetical protein